MDISRQRIDVEVRNLGLTWTKLSTLGRQRTEKRILNGVSAEFPSGQVTAILGPSGYILRLVGDFEFWELMRDIGPGKVPFCNYWHRGRWTQASGRVLTSRERFCSMGDLWIEIADLRLRSSNRRTITIYLLSRLVSWRPFQSNSDWYVV